MVPLGVVAVLGRPIDAVVALQAAGAMTTSVLLCLGEAFHRSSYFGVAIVCAVLTWVSGIVFARFFGRHL
jgi:multisubunit Na+/H+ antiporter MnhF subunit